LKFCSQNFENILAGMSIVSSKVVVPLFRVSNTFEQLLRGICCSGVPRTFAARGDLQFAALSIISQSNSGFYKLIHINKLLSYLININ